MGGTGQGNVQCFYSHWGEAKATSGVWAFLAAVDAIGSGEIDQALVLEDKGQSCVAACFLTS